MKKKYITSLWLAATALTMSSCFGDKGNYDYSEIDDVVIGEKGFDGDTIYNLRTDEVDRLDIVPELSYSLGGNGSGSYSYEWVAVSTNKRIGQRTVLSRERDLAYPVRLQADNYDLFYKVTDNTTGIVYSRQATLNVNNLYTSGWILAGKDAEDNMVVDMLSISRDTMHLKDILGDKGLALKHPLRIWTDNSPEIYEDKVYVCTEEGTFRYGRENFDNPVELTIFDPELKGYRHGIVMHDIQKINDKRALFLADDYAYSLQSLDEGEFGNPVSYYQTADGYDYFTPGGKIACNRTSEDISAAAIEQYFLFNTRDKKFCYLRQLISYMNDAADSDTEEPFSWDTKKDFSPNGLDFVTTVNSLYSGGQSVTLLRNPSDGQLYIYTYTITRTSGTAAKGRRYAVPASVSSLYDARLFSMSTRQGYLIYASGDALYGYNFRSGNSVKLYDFGGETSTAIFNDIVSDEKQQDCFYVATYREGASDGRGGKLYKFSVTDSADKIEVTNTTSWNGFPYIVDISYKKF